MSIVLLGAGNVGWHLGHRLVQQGLTVSQVYSRYLPKALELADALNCQGICQLEALNVNADLYILAVSDAAIAPLSDLLSQRLTTAARIIHCSGATPTDAICQYFTDRGVLYPLQSFSRQRPVHFQQVPLCVCASTSHFQSQLLSLAQQLSGKSKLMEDEQRLKLHLAAVWVNNFTNALYGIAEELVAENDIPFDWLLPLIAETAAKVQTLSPALAQTGPAIRGDQQTIDRHLSILHQHPQWAALYKLLTDEIASRR
jgi:predicted short-subunit dehydrogenase-like oxidoreductase (DUF2520 family)